MFNKKTKNVVEEVKVVTNEPKPEPIKINSGYSEEYFEISKELGVECNEVFHAIASQILIDCDCVIYPFDTVEAYLIKNMPSDRRLVWAPLLTDKFKCSYNERTANLMFGNVYKYFKTVPIEVLRLVKKIHQHPMFDRIKEVVDFCVSDYPVRNPDPFLCMICMKKPFVIYMWDEPKFKMSTEDLTK